MIIFVFMLSYATNRNILGVFGMTLQQKSNRLDGFKNFKLHDNDSGSSEVQIAMLTDRISHLQSHLEKHRKDHGTRRSLVKLVEQRRRLLKYLNKNKTEDYQKLIKALGLRK